MSKGNKETKILVKQSHLDSNQDRIIFSAPVFFLNTNLQWISSLFLKFVPKIPVVSLMQVHRFFFQGWKRKELRFKCRFISFNETLETLDFDDKFLAVFILILWTRTVIKLRIAFSFVFSKFLSFITIFMPEKERILVFLVFSEERIKERKEKKVNGKERNRSGSFSLFLLHQNLLSFFICYPFFLYSLNLLL